VHNDDDDNDDDHSVIIRLLSLLLAQRNLPSLGRRLSIPVSPGVFFVPIALETLGAIAPCSLDFLTGVGRRLTAATGDARETAFLFQRISIYSTVQCGTLT